MQGRLEGKERGTEGGGPMPEELREELIKSITQVESEQNTEDINKNNHDEY